MILHTYAIVGLAVLGLALLVAAVWRPHRRLFRVGPRRQGARQADGRWNRRGVAVYTSATPSFALSGLGDELGVLGIGMGLPPDEVDKRRRALSREARPADSAVARLSPGAS
ncbi:MAG: hypothetical protein ACREMB_25960 [Candidatus Rokuibacteriota bacterium]